MLLFSAPLLYRMLRTIVDLYCEPVVVAFQANFAGVSSPIRGCFIFVVR